MSEVGRHVVEAWGLGIQLDERLTVLVVDDEPLIALAIADALEEAGFAHELCHSGDSAMATIDDREPAFCALVTDIRLGKGPTGWDVARHARVRHAALPVVYITGDSAADHSAYGVPESVMVQKPFVAMQIITAISNLLNVG
ncbi:MAG: response regulator [Novosphingobium sp.]